MSSNRRAKRKNSRTSNNSEEIKCVLYLSTDEHQSEELANAKEQRQYNYMKDYLKKHNLTPIKIRRAGCFSNGERNKIFIRCIEDMIKGSARAIVVANMAAISIDEVDSYRKVGLVKSSGFRIFSVDEGELCLPLINFSEGEKCCGY